MMLLNARTIGGMPVDAVFAVLTREMYGQEYGIG
jgi:hypothetical protein